MNDFILTYTITLTFICVLASLFCVYRYYLGNKLTQQANKLKSQMANIRQQFPEFEEKRSQMVAQGLGDIGIDGILDELGLGMFAPIAKGFLSNPENIKKIMPILEKAGIKIPDAKSKTQETDLL